MLATRDLEAAVHTGAYSARPEETQPTAVVAAAPSAILKTSFCTSTLILRASGQGPELQQSLLPGSARRGPSGSCTEEGAPRWMEALDSRHPSFKRLAGLTWQIQVGASEKDLGQTPPSGPDPHISIFQGVQTSARPRSLNSLALNFKLQHDREEAQSTKL